MTIEFDLNNLNGIYSETISSPEKAVAFDMEFGKGQFLFMLFLSDEDKKSKDKLFVYMRNTKNMRTLKMYGNHLKGKFLLYFSDDIQSDFINEMQLNVNNNHGFSFEDFLNYINNNLPQSISRQARKNNLFDNSSIVNYISDDEKTVLIGPRILTKGKPQDKTLRKLYLYTEASAYDIDRLIESLVKANITVAWTTVNNTTKVADIYDYIKKYCV